MFLFLASCPTLNGFAEMQGTYACDVFINMDEFQDYVIVQMKEGAGCEIELKGRPVISFLYELSEKEYNEWNRKVEPTNNK